jgi:hypothetical protein
VGTEYHWYILAHQNVKKVDANRYTTSMTGIKYKLAHRRAERENWNITEAPKEATNTDTRKFNGSIKGGNKPELI